MAHFDNLIWPTLGRCLAFIRRQRRRRGDFCLADEKVAPPTLDFNSNLSYAVEGGIGPFATETGNGNLTASDIIVNPTGTTFLGTGEITMTGTLSKN